MKRLNELKLEWKQRMKRLGINAPEFCEQSGISYSTFTQMKNPTISLVGKIEDTLVKLENQDIYPIYSGEMIKSFGIEIDDRDNLVSGIALLLEVAFLCHNKGYSIERLRISEANFIVYSSSQAQNIINDIEEYLHKKGIYYCVDVTSNR